MESQDPAFQVAQWSRVCLPCRRCRRRGFDPWVRKIPWRREWQPQQVLLPGESHGQRSLEGYSPWGHKESDTTERLSHHPWGGEMRVPQKLSAKCPLEGLCEGRGGRSPGSCLSWGCPRGAEA